MAKQLRQSPTRTTPGSYQAPVEGIVDYGEFQKGFEGAFILPQTPDFEKMEGFNEAVFAVDEGNKLTGGEAIYKDEASALLVDEWAKGSNLEYRKGDTKRKKELEQNIAQMNTYTTNKGVVFNALGDEKLYDTNFNVPVIDENGEAIEAVTWADINRVHKKYSASQNRKAGTKDVIRDGKVIGQKAGEYMTVNGKEIFINYEDMDEKWVGKNFKINYNHNASLSKNTPKDFKNVVEETDKTKTTSDIELQPGDKGYREGQNTFYSAGTTMIKDTWYAKTNAAAAGAAQEAFNFDQGVMGDGYESAFRQFMGENFKLNPQMIEQFNKQGLDIQNASQITPEIARSLSAEAKTMMLQDYFTETWKYRVATEGYTKGDDGRAIENRFAKTSDIRRREEEQEAPTGAGKVTKIANIAGDLYSELNRVSKGAEPYLETKDEGDEISGEYAAGTNKLLTNRTYNGEEIAEVKYVKGKGKYGVVMKITTQSKGVLTDQPDVILNNQGQRNRFINSLLIEDETLGTPSEIRAGIDEYDVIQDFRIKAQNEVFKDLQGVGGPGRNTWQDLSRALKNNSSEGLSPQEKVMFFAAGYGQ